MTHKNSGARMNIESITTELIDYLKSGNPLLADLQLFPIDSSLVELGYLDSFGIVDVIVFIEGRYKITIEDSEITKEKFGSIRKMATLIYSKL